MRIRRRWKVLASGIMALVCIGVLFNIWFVQNTNAIIESLVSDQSNGHIQLHLKRSTFQYFRKKIVLYGATFYSSDTSGAKTNYQFDVPKLDVKLRSFWSFFMYRELLIDSIHLNTPEVTVTRITKSPKQDQSNVSVPEEVGRIYNSILDALQVLQVRRFQIDNGKFNLVNNTEPNQPVTSISNIHFQLNNLNIKSDSNAAQKFLYSDDVLMRVNNQDIILPDGIHRISFKNLLINVGRKQVQLDSCWVKAETAVDQNSFRIFFDVLKMTNLDFAALYKKNEIKADSVYINNPDIGLSLQVKQKRERNKKLELDTIIQQFTGDLALGYIGVQNAAVHIVANRGDTTTTFSSNKDNFEMRGLRINSDSSKPVFVDEFAMILRKYETYSRDSSNLYRFDSIRFTNNKVRLSNFTIQSIPDGSGKSSLYYSIPAFELTGLSWEDLLFDRYISAEKAVLFNPEIQYTVRAAKRKNISSSLFKVLSGLNESIDLDAVEIRNGNLNIQLPGDKRLTLQQVNLALASNKLLASKSYTGMKEAIDELSFRNAIFTTGNLHAELLNLHYSDRLYADELRIMNSSKTIEARATGITMNDLVWNNDKKSVLADHLAWQQANLIFRTAGKPGSISKANALIQLKAFTGRNTEVIIYAKDKIIKTKLDLFQFDDLIKKGSEDAIVEGLTATGKAFDINAPDFHVTGGAYHLVDNSTSSLRNVSFIQQSPKDSLRIDVSQTFLKPHIQELLKGILQFDKVTLTAPVFNIATNAVVNATSKQTIHLPQFSINELAVANPTFQYVKRDTSTTTINWLANTTGIENNAWTFYNVHTIPQQALLTIASAKLAGNQFLFTRNAKQFGIDSGSMHLTFNNITVGGRDSLQWRAFLQEALFQNPISRALKTATGLSIDEAQLRHLQLSSETVKNVYRLIQASPAMQLRLSNGSFANDVSTMEWKHVLYYQENQSLSLDSFRYQPTLPRDSFIAQAPGQKDYMQALLKKITISHINLNAIEKDSVFAARTVLVDGASLDIYRDKRKPFIAEKLRPLPVLALQNIPVKMALDTVALKNATVTYTEMSDRTEQEGSLSVNRISTQLFPVRNFNIGAQDSLTWRAEGYLMDSAWLRLQLKESYIDSLGTFAVTLRAKPIDLCILNPALMPLASVKITSGTLDTITMRAIGHEYFSIGEMQMYYKNLKVQFLKKGSETKKSFLTGLITFAANNFVIKKANDHRTAAVYFLRNRDRSVFNFLIKTAMSGIASSVGAKRSKKYYRQYKRQQKLYNLPPVDLG